MIPKNDTELNRQIANRLAVRNNVSDQFLRRYERILISQYQVSLKKIQNDYYKLAERFGDDPAINLAVYNARNRKLALEKKISESLKELGSKNIKMINRSVKGQFQDGYYSTQYAHEASMALEFNFPVLNNEQIQSSLLNPVDAIKWQERAKTNINQLNNKVRETITQGIIQGDPVQVTARNLKKHFGTVTNNAIRIVRTESHRAREMGNAFNYDKTEDSFERLGLKRDKVWNATLDARTRPSHGNADNKKANKDSLFELFGATPFPAPGLSGIAKQDINCRCTTISDVEGFSPQTRLDNENKQIKAYTTFGEWAKSQNLTKNIYGQKYFKDVEGVKPLAKVKPKVTPKSRFDTSHMTKAESKIRDRKTERAVIFDDSGNEIFAKSGTRKSVGFTTAESFKFANNNSTLTHNHPSGGSFSLDDIMLASTHNLREVRAVGRTADYSAMKTVDGWPKPSDITKSYNTAYGKTKNKFDRLIKDNKIHWTDANKQFFDNIWGLVSKDLDFIYTKTVIK